MALDTSTETIKIDQKVNFDLEESTNERKGSPLQPTRSETGHVHEPYEIPPEPRLRDLPITIWHIPRFVVLGFIRLYQATFSRALPPGTCRFYPTCSHYGYQAIYKYGVIKGGVMAAWRVLRCNPFNPGGFDPVQ